MESLAKLLLDSPQFQLQKLELDHTHHQINLMISSVEQKGACPVCDKSRKHGSEWEGRGVIPYSTPNILS